MALSYATYTGDGAKKQFDLTFGYLRKNHVFVFVDGYFTSYKWISPTRVELAVAPLNGQEVVVRRLTDRINRITTFSDGMTLLAGDLNAADLQNFYIMQEFTDQIADNVLTGAIPINDAGSSYITEQWLAEQLEFNLTQSQALSMLQDQITAEAQARAAAILQEAQDRVAADGALGTRVDDAETLIANVNYELTDPAGSVAQQVGFVSARVDDVEADTAILMTSFADANGNALARINLVAAATGGDPAQIEIVSGDGLGQVIITGSTRINGDVMVAGSITGISIASEAITADHLSSNFGTFENAIRVGTDGSGADATFIAGNGYNTEYRIWSGDEVPDNAPFRVTKDGGLRAEDLEIYKGGELVFSSEAGFTDFGRNLILINSGQLLNPLVESLDDDTDFVPVTLTEDTAIDFSVTIPAKTVRRYYSHGQSIPTSVAPATITINVQRALAGGSYTTILSQVLTKDTHYEVVQVGSQAPVLLLEGEGGDPDVWSQGWVDYQLRGKGNYKNASNGTIYPYNETFANTTTVAGASASLEYRIDLAPSSTSGVWDSINTSPRTISMYDTSPGIGFIRADSGSSSGGAVDADTVQGYAPSAYNVFTGNALVSRHPSGYIYSNYYNMSANQVTGVPSRVPVEIGSDGFLRWQAWSQFVSNLSAAGLGGGASGDFIRADADDSFSGQLSYDGSDTPALSLSSSTYASKRLLLGGWQAPGTGLATVKVSSNLHIDSATDGDIYFNYYNQSRYNRFYGPSLHYSNVVVYGGNRFHVEHDSYFTGFTMERKGASPSYFSLQNNGNLIQHHYNGTGYTFSLNGSERARFDSDGILTGGVMRFGAGSGLGVRFWDSSNYSIYMSQAANATWGGRGALDSTSDYNMYFKMSSGTERGFVFLNGTTPIAAINPARVQASRFSAGYAQAASNSFGCSNWFRSYGNSGWHNDQYGGGIYMQDTTWVRVYGSKALYVQNTIASTGNITAYYSDERLKTRVGAIDNALDKVLSLDGFIYVENDLAKSFGYDNDARQVGLSAQQVKAVLPEAVTLAPFDMETSEDGTISSKSGEDYMTLDYAKVVPLLVEAIKEQQKQIDELKEKRKWHFKLPGLSALLTSLGNLVGMRRTP